MTSPEDQSLAALPRATASVAGHAGPRHGREVIIQSHGRGILAALVPGITQKSSGKTCESLCRNPRARHALR
jgi:hypothetical protein